MYQLIACDLDETLLDARHEVCQRNRDAVAAARERGVRFVLATGRGFASVKHELKSLGLWDEPGEYVISYNGAAITENRSSRLLSFDGIPFEFAEELHRRAREYDVCVHVYTVDGAYAWRMQDEERRYLGRKLDGVTEVEADGMGFLRGERIAKVLYSNPDMGYLQRVARELEPVTGDADVSYSSNRYLEFNRKGVNKGAGLARLAGMLGVPLEETIAIGDNWNDISMIRTAGLGAGVANVADEVRPYCGYVAQADNCAGGVAEVIEKFVLLGCAGR